MWEPGPLTAPWDFTVCYRDSCTFLPYLIKDNTMKKCGEWMYAFLT
jgi:hypothetical protein